MKYLLFIGLQYVVSIYGFSQQFSGKITNRPANEDNSIVAPGYTVMNASLGYNWKQIRAGFIIENRLNNDWNETQFATESRLYDETRSVEEIHFIPGTPFNLKFSISYCF